MTSENLHTCVTFLNTHHARRFSLLSPFYKYRWLGKSKHYVHLNVDSAGILIQDSVILNSNLSPNSPWNVSSTEGPGNLFPGKKEGLAGQVFEGASEKGEQIFSSGYLTSAMRHRQSQGNSVLSVYKALPTLS